MNNAATLSFRSLLSTRTIVVSGLPAATPVAPSYTSVVHAIAYDTPCDVSATLARLALVADGERLLKSVQLREVLGTMADRAVTGDR